MLLNEKRQSFLCLYLDKIKENQFTFSKLSPAFYLSLNLRKVLQTERGSHISSSPFSVFRRPKEIADDLGLYARRCLMPRERCAAEKCFDFLVSTVARALKFQMKSSVVYFVEAVPPTEVNDLTSPLGFCQATLPALISYRTSLTSTPLCSSRAGQPPAAQPERLSCNLKTFPEHLPDCSASPLRASRPNPPAHSNYKTSLPASSRVSQRVAASLQEHSSSNQTASPLPDS